MTKDKKTYETLLKKLTHQHNERMGETPMSQEAFDRWYSMANFLPEEEKEYDEK